MRIRASLSLSLLCMVLGIAEGAYNCTGITIRKEVRQMVGASATSYPHPLQI